MTPIFYAVLSFFLLWILGNIFTYPLQHLFIFRPSRLSSDFQYAFDLPFKEMFFKTPNDGKINALWFQNPTQQRPIVFYFHGNRGDLTRWGEYSTFFDALGYDFLVFDYRGYGKSTGKKNEANFHQDARSLFDFLLQHYPADQIVLYGRSIGSGVCCYLGAQVEAKMVILETPYHSIPNLFSTYYPFLPIFLFRFKYTFNNHHSLPEAKSPAYIFHGTRDIVIPYRCAVRLKPYLPTPSHFYTINGARHGDLAQFDRFNQLLRKILS